MGRRVARAAAPVLALALVAIGVFALITTAVLAAETDANQMGAFDTLVLFVLATAGSGSALAAGARALLALSKGQDLRLYARGIAIAAASYAGWVAFAFYTLWRAISLPPG